MIDPKTARKLMPTELHYQLREAEDIDTKIRKAAENGQSSLNIKYIHDANKRLLRGLGYVIDQSTFGASKGSYYIRW